MEIRPAKNETIPCPPSLVVCVVVDLGLTSGDSPSTEVPDCAVVDVGWVGVLSRVAIT